MKYTFEEYYYLAGDEKSSVGNADPLDAALHWDYFENKESTFQLAEPLKFRINQGRFSGETGDFQFNSCGFSLFSNKLRKIFEKHLTEIDKPKWFPAQVIDLTDTIHEYSILHLFEKRDFLDHGKSTFVPGTDQPIKKRFDLKKINERLVYSAGTLGSSLCVHDIVRKEIKQAKCTGIYFFKIHTPGRLS